MRERIIVAVVFIPPIFIILFFLPPYALVAAVAIVCAISAYELLHNVGVKASKRVTLYAVVSAALIPVGIYFGTGELVFTAVLLVLLCFVFIEAILVFKTKRQIAFAQIMTALFGGVLIPFLLSSLISLKNMQEGHLLVFLPLISAFITDAGAYFAGVFFGKHNAFPHISPKKTVEGYIGGLVFGTAAMVLYGAILYFATLFEIRFWALILYGAIGAVIAELGDLAFSLVKREFDIKDYGRLLPGHGGMLDRLDSMVFTAPAMYLLVSVIPAINVN